MTQFQRLLHNWLEAWLAIPAIDRDEDIVGYRKAEMVAEEAYKELANYSQAEMDEQDHKKLKDLEDALDWFYSKQSDDDDWNL